jgi:parallel beta-helix repeat protein
MRQIRLTGAIAGLVVIAATAGAQVPTVELTAGMVITTSVRIAPKTYRLSAPASMDSAVITIRGDDITVDLSDVVLDGSPAGADPDMRAGVAIRVDGGRNVRIQRARVRGYKVGILARGTRSLTLANNDLSDNWRPRLFSLVGHESLVDWMSYHHNEKDEWLRFGAAIYLVDVRHGEIHDNVVERGMNGLMMVRSDSLRILSNTFSFNSAIGIGLYRSSDNYIAHNRVSYNVRGYSHGFYRRGQDSAALLIYEQSCRNVVAYNAMTHSGDGLFLWAGQTTMDTGEGGANDNLFFGNDFSYAPTNGMEATFSRNMFIANRVVGSDHGLWGGYSFDSKIIGNDFSRNRIAIAIEHGQNNEISLNGFTADSTAISLWANPIEPSDWGYPKHRDTASRDYTISGNVFRHNRVQIRAANTTGVRLTNNTLDQQDSIYVVRDTVAWTIGDNIVRAAEPISDAERETRASITPLPVPPTVARLAPPPIPGAFMPTATMRDRSSIIVTEWGPYDWRSPLLWPSDTNRGPSIRLRVLGPPGDWDVVGHRGLTRVSKQHGAIGSSGIDSITVTPAAGQTGDWELTLEHVGDERRPVYPYERISERFTYRRFEPANNWNVKFFTWRDSTTDPQRNPAAVKSLLTGKPTLTRQATRLDYMWYRPTIKGIPQERFAIEATASVSLGAGEYTLRTISDDGVREWVDGKLVIDNWTPHESKVDHAPISGGKHDIRVEYYQLNGWTELRLDIVPGVVTSEGSPGPH